MYCATSRGGENKAVRIGIIVIIIIKLENPSRRLGRADKARVKVSLHE